MTSTNRFRIASALILIASASIAVGAPWALAEGHSGRGYERGAANLAFGGVFPHVLLAVLWFQWRSVRAQKALTALAALLLAATIVFYRRFFYSPEELGGTDMWFLGVVVLPIGLSIGVLVASAIAAICLKISSPDTQTPPDSGLQRPVTRCV